ncbi:hypothetical protein NQ317_011226 [Molorchus minor]|uniref:C2H2-type domain-containing protein n=1 Tax=Molorchus minor TaxID=1323400 RepID=A0ABQ9IXE9_9CUCU|nr:hypothetical protein NQ317_011226 [Molorchus minor]
MFKCETCKYQTKYKRALIKHLLTHNRTIKIRIFKCETCGYQTKHRRALNRHLLNHKEVSEVQMFKCEICEFQTRHRENLKSHVLNHKDISEVPMFKCEMCEYQTNERERLNATCWFTRIFQRCQCLSVKYRHIVQEYIIRLKKKKSVASNKLFLTVHEAGLG